MDYVGQVPVTNAVVKEPSELTARWLADALGTTPIADFTVERIGTGQMSECYRVSITYDAPASVSSARPASGSSARPASVVLKVAAADPNSRQTGLAMGLYEREVRFYSDIAPAITDAPVAHCYDAGFDAASGAFHLLLADATPATVGDEIRGATVEQATLALRQLGHLHGPLLGALQDVDWLNRPSPLNQPLMAALYAGFLDRYADRIDPQHRAVCDRLVEVFDAYLAADSAAEQPRGLVHGDYRLDNMLFGVEKAQLTGPLTVVDWQTVTWGPVLADAAYFLGCALPADVRRDNYDALLQAYLDGLGSAAGLDLDAIRDGVRRQSFFGVVMAIASSVMVERTERGDQMFMTMLERHCRHIIDTGALSLLDQVTPPEPLQPSVFDEDIHPAGDDKFWNESWYFDFADPGQGIGGWIRLGLVPNQQHCWINALLCGPDMPTVAMLDWHAPMPADHTHAAGTDMALTLDVLDPLHSFRVTAQGTGEVFDDPSALLRGESGRRVPLAMDLTWHSAGTPYQYRISTRYEIPATITGTVTADGRTYEFNAVAGQRDHSWAPRDWWSMEWMWCALHLDDGTHLHGVDMRIPGMGPIGIGYQQSAGAPLLEVQSVTSTEAFDASGLPTTADIGIGDVLLSVQVLGHAPVQLISDEGRVSHFPRVWATVRTTDGRTGVGWLEWNRNQ